MSDGRKGVNDRDAEASHGLGLRRWRADHRIRGVRAGLLRRTLAAMLPVKT